MILPIYSLERVYLPTASLGSMFPGLKRVEDLIFAKTLELAWRDNAISSNPDLASCIPEGIYLVVKEPPKVSRPYSYFRIVYVPGRHWDTVTKMSSVLIHPANHTSQLLGCIAPGSRHRDINSDAILDIEDSTKKLAWMVKNLPKAFELHIRKKAA